MSRRFHTPVGLLSLTAPPASPGVGDTYFDTVLGSIGTFDGAAWVYGKDTQGFSFIQDTAPTADQPGDTWFDTATGNSFVWFDDGSSAQWVQFAPAAGGGGGVSADPANQATLGTDGLPWVQPDVVVKATEPTAADFGAAAIPVGAVWVQSV